MPTFPSVSPPTRLLATPPTPASRVSPDSGGCERAILPLRAESAGADPGAGELALDELAGADHVADAVLARLALDHQVDVELLLAQHVEEGAPVDLALPDRDLL